MQRHAGGGIAARTIACLPALTGAWREAAGGIVLTTADFYRFDHAGLERPDLLAGRRPRVINHSALGDALTAADPPVRVTLVYNNNPVAVCPDSEKVIAGFSREDLFTVVMDHFQTDTADYADIVLPATTQLEHYDVHKSYGHLYMLANNPAIAPVGESLPNSEVFRRLAARLGFDDPCFRDSDEDLCRTALNGKSWESLKQTGWQKLDVPERFAPFAQGGFPTPSGKCEFHSAWLEKQGIDPLPFYNPPAEAGDAALEKKYPARLPLAAGAPLPQFHLRQRRALPGIRERAAPRPAPAGRRGARHRRRRHGAGVQRPRQPPPARARQRQAAGRGGRRAVGMVEEVFAGRRQRQQPYVAAHRRSWRRRHVLRLPGASRKSVRAAA